MKNCILGMIGCMLTLLLSLILLTQYNVLIHKNELEQVVPEVLYEVMQTALAEEGDGEEAAVQLLQNRLEEEIVTEGSLQVQIRVCDPDAGILSVDVSRSFPVPGGKEREIFLRKTLILDREGDARRAEIRPAKSLPTPVGIRKDAFDFCRQYGSEAVFCPEDERNGMILFGTMSPGGESSGTTYRTIGWKMVLKLQDGRKLQQIYLKLGGSRLALLHAGTEGTMHAQLFGISLSTLQGLLNSEAKQALKEGRCRLTLDACMTVAENGRPQGSMTDAGVFTGEVYDSYEAIARARPWMETSREALRQYFGREIRGLFLTVRLSGDEGIKSLQGAGNYCYGTEVTLLAKLKEDYRFDGWTGDTADEKEQLTLRVTRNLSLTAHSSYVDREPELFVSDLYYSLWDFKLGKVTEEEILSHYLARDHEDGRLLPGQGFLLQREVQKEMQESDAAPEEEGDRKIYYQVTAEDTAGHQVTKGVTIFIVDTQLQEYLKESRIRFISAEYFKRGEEFVSPEDGGLSSDSIWRTDPVYCRLLEKALE